MTPLPGDPFEATINKLVELTQQERAKVQERRDTAIAELRALNLKLALTNNMGNITREEVEVFWSEVQSGLSVWAEFQWGSGFCNQETRTCYIREDLIGGYPYVAKQYVLHEAAHLDTWGDDVHGELFHRELARLTLQFLGQVPELQP